MTIKRTQYQFKDGKTTLSAETFNAIFFDLDARLHGLEQMEVSWEDAVSELQQYGLSRINGALGPVLDQANSDVAAMEQQKADITDWWNQTIADLAINTGAIVAFPYGKNPLNSLLCDGSLVSKAVYNTLYDTIGDIFNYVANQYVCGKPWRQQFFFNDADGTIGTWTTGTSLPGALYGSQAVVTNSRVYLLGGYNGSAVSTVYQAPINADGTIGTWTTGTSLPGALYGSQAVVTNSRVYLLGGYNGSTVSTVYQAPINADGTIGTWTTGTSLPGALYGSQAVVTNSRVYLLGGVNGSAVSTVYQAPINADGTIGTWTTGTSLPGALYVLTSSSNKQ